MAPACGVSQRFFRRPDNEEDSCSPLWPSPLSARPRRRLAPTSARAPTTGSGLCRADLQLDRLLYRRPSRRRLLQQQQFQRPGAERLQRPTARRRAGRRRLAVRAELGRRCRRPVQLARQEQLQCDLPRAASSSTTISARSASITARVGYTWGPGLLYVKGGYAYSDNNDTLTFAGAPVAFALDTQPSRRLHRRRRRRIHVRPELVGQGRVQYYNFGDTRFVTPAALVPFGSFHNDEHT